MNSTLAHLTQHLPPVTVDVAANAELMAKEHKPDTRLQLRELPSLEQQRGSLVYRIAGRKKDIEGQAPLVSELRRRATVALDELTALTEANQSGKFELRWEIRDKQREYDRLESKWAAESKLLAAYENILTGAEKLLKEWDRENGDRLKKLREMDRKLTR